MAGLLPHHVDQIERLAAKVDASSLDVSYDFKTFRELPLKEQMPVKLTIGALQDISLDATLEYIAPKGIEENGVVMFEIKAATKVPADIFIRAGYSANADIVIERREGVLTIPESSVTFEGNKTYVNLLTSDSTAVEQTFERKEVVLGMSDGVNIEIKEGLSGNENIKGEKITTPR